MRRRLLVAFIGIVLCSLAITWTGIRLMSGIQADTLARRQTAGYVTAVAAAFNQGLLPVAQQSYRPDRLDRIRHSLGLRRVGIVLVAADATIPIKILAPIPPAIDLGALRSPDLASGTTLSGVDEGNAWAMAAVNPGQDAPLLVVLVSRQVTDPLGPAMNWLLAAGLVAIAVAVVAALRLSTVLARPVVEATDAALRIAGGDLDTRLPKPPAKRTDEVADLARALNSMVEGLDRSRGLERQFLLSVSHDLRTPLTSIRGYAEAMADGTMEDPRRAGAIILSESQRLDRLVSDLLNLARLDARRFTLDLAPSDIAVVTTDVVDGFTPTALESGVSLGSMTSNHRLTAIVDVDRWAQVVANLVENGLRYANSSLDVDLTETATGIQLSVRDDGPGIPADDLPHVFERLYASKRRPDVRESGSGLGLAIVRELVQAMGGSVWAESQPGGGASLVVQLPGMESSDVEE